jgi:hypothetical protein
MRKASAIYDCENTRQDEIQPALQKAISSGMDGLLDEDASQYDEAVIWTVSKKGGSLDRAAVAIIQDDGLELGDGGFDPSTQASFSMLKFWARKKVSCKHNSLNLPSIY